MEEGEGLKHLENLCQLLIQKLEKVFLLFYCN